MATNPIYVETEEEISEIVERLRRSNGDDTMLVLPLRSRIGQSRFNFQLLRNYASRMGKRVTVVCDDPAVQKMASESGFAVFGAVGVQGEGIASEPEAEPPPRRWWQRRQGTAATHIGIAAPNKLITKNATELRPGRFLLYLAAAMLLLVGLFGIVVYVPSASVTLVAQAQPFSQKAVEIQAQPGKAPIRVRTSVISRSNSQGFKTTGRIQVRLAPAVGQVVYYNSMSQPNCPRAGCTSPGLVVLKGQRLDDSQDGITFAQLTANYQGGVLVPWGGAVTVNVVALTAGTSGNVGNGVINTIQGNPYDKLTVTNPQATGGGTNASSTPIMTVSDFDAARAVLEQELRQSIAQQIAAAAKAGEKLSETLIYGAPQFSTDHQPNEKVAGFNGTMTLQGEGDFYFDSDVHKAFETHLIQFVPNNQQLLTESPISVDYRILSATKGGFLTFLGDTSAFVAPKLDMDKLRSQVVGRPLAQARFYLQGLNVRSVAIKEQPMTLPLMPFLASRISIHYQVDPAVVQSLTNSPNATPSPGASLRILAVDPGSKRVGLALSDPTATIAQALATVSAEPHGTLAARLAQIATRNEAARIVVGLPKRLDGSRGPEAKAAQLLADEIRKESGLPVELVDERLTTVAAERSLIAGGVKRDKRRLTVDRVAATLMLQAHLDRRRAG